MNCAVQFQRGFFNWITFRWQAKPFKNCYFLFFSYVFRTLFFNMWSLSSWASLQRMLQYISPFTFLQLIAVSIMHGKTAYAPQFLPAKFSFDVAQNRFSVKTWRVQWPLKTQVLVSPTQTVFIQYFTGLSISCKANLKRTSTCSFFSSGVLCSECVQRPLQLSTIVIIFL